MKSLHRNNLFTWSEFNTEKNIDFNSFLLITPQGNVVIDPVEMTEHDRKHLKELGGVDWIIITNSDHIRNSLQIQSYTGAKLVGPSGEKNTFPFSCDHYLKADDQLVPGLVTLELNGSKTPNELSFIFEETTLITADLIRSHKANQLMILPKNKLKDYEKAKNSIRLVSQFITIETILVGDGWHIFENGHAKLKNLSKNLE